MTTLIAQYNSEGCVGRCDAKCYSATSPECDCICGGLNHGAGKAQAMDNTERLAEQWIEEYQQAHPEVERYFVRKNGKLVRHEQMELFAEATHAKENQAHIHQAGRAAAAPAGESVPAGAAALQPGGDAAIG